MRTFSEYINESRQKYIFGGTDDRNTKLDTTFNEIEVGDELYYWTKWESNKKNYRRGVVSKIKNDVDTSRTKIFVKRDGVDRLWVECSMIDLKKTYVTDYVNFCCSTSFAELQVKVKEIFKFDIYEDDVIICEANQNYIFGGTDDRNTDVDAKTFSELEPGEKFYWFFIENDGKRRGAWCLTFCRKEMAGLDVKMFFTPTQYVMIDRSNINKDTFVSKGRQMTYVSSTDYNLFIETVKKKLNAKLEDSDIIER